MSAPPSDIRRLLQVFLTLMVYVVFGPLIGAAAALLIIIPIAMASFGSGMAMAFGGLLLGNPWLPYFYGLVPSALTGIILVIREAQAGPPRLGLVALIGALAGFVGAVFSGGRFNTSNPTQIGLYVAAGVVGAIVCHLLAGWLRRRILP